MKLNLGRYAKFVTAIVGQAIAYASLYWGAGPDAKYVTIAIAVASALGVYAVPNQAKPAANALAPPEPSNVTVMPQGSKAIDPPQRSAF